MPIQNSTYSGPPFYLFNGHLETIIPSLFRKVDGVKYRREKIITPDEDFLNLDWSEIGSDRLWCFLTVLEGDSMRHYIMGLVKLLILRGLTP